MTPKPIIILRDNGDIKLDLEAVFEDPKATAIKWLIQYAEKNRKEGKCQES